MFIDEVIKKYPDIPIPDAVFKIQNVGDYYYQVEKNGSIDYQDDVISYLLPFNSTWFEFKIPTKIRIGNNFESVPFSVPIGVYGKVYQVQENLIIIAFSIYQEVGTELICTVIKQFFCDNKGKYLGRKLSKRRDMDFSPETYHPIIIEIIPKDLLSEILSELNPVLMALNFLNCKNVKNINNAIDAKLIKSRTRKNKPYFEKYYTLQIESIKKVLNSEGQAQTLGLKHALHICRGHFKTYDEIGLFGKYKGTYWWPSTVKGNKDIGIINKDYNIKCPT